MDATDDERPPVPAGTRVGRYVLADRLGVGGMAEVYRAHATGALGFALPVAMKWLKPGIGDRPDLAAMFVTEAQIATRLRHPNIVAVTDFDRDGDGRLYLVMELVLGKDLAALAATGPLPAVAVVHLATELARGLGFAHELPDAGDGVRGLIHRDVSPQNTLLSWQGAVKVSDFGIAKLRAATQASGTIHVSGKPAYMSPEQAKGAALDGRSDLFALGVIMWELLTGRRLFAGGDTREVLARVLYAPITDPRRLCPGLADDLAALTLRLLARPVAERPAHARELIAALVACRDAPRDGEAVLAALLAARFPGEGPTERRPGLPARSGEPSAASAATLVSQSAEAATLVGHGAAGARPVMSPTLRALQDAETPTRWPPPALRPPRTSDPTRATLMLALVAVALALVAAILLLTR